MIAAVLVGLVGLASLEGCGEPSEIGLQQQDSTRLDQMEAVCPVQGIADSILLRPLNILLLEMRRSYLENGGTLARPMTREELFK